MLDIPILILAGGSGERMKILTGGKPKTLLRLVGKYLVEYSLENVVSLGGKEVFLVVNNPKDFEDIAIKYGRKLKIELITQRKPGIEGAILSAKDYINSDFVLLYGDIIAPPNMYRELLHMYYYGGEFGVVVIPEEETESYVVAKLHSITSIDAFIEGSAATNMPGLYVVGGAYALPREFLDTLESHNNILSALNEINSRFRLRPCIWSGWWVDTEYPWDLLRASLYVLYHLEKSMISRDAVISPNAIIEGPVIIEDGVEIDHYAIIKGPVYIGAKSYIGSHSLIRNYVALEGENIVGAHTEVVWSSIQKRASIGSKSYIGFSIVGENSVIEPGVVTINIVPEKMKIARAIKTERRGREYVKLGAIIGYNSRVSAYSILKPGETVPIEYQGSPST